MVSKHRQGGCYELSYELTLDSEISLVVPFSFEFTIKNLRCSLNVIFFKIITLKRSMKLKFEGD